MVMYGGAVPTMHGGLENSGFRGAENTVTEEASTIHGLSTWSL
jgi:hypothetical protein